MIISGNRSKTHGTCKLFCKSLHETSAPLLQNIGCHIIHAPTDQFLRNGRIIHSPGVHLVAVSVHLSHDFSCQSSLDTCGIWDPKMSKI